jgi:hypothetical protein
MFGFSGLSSGLNGATARLTVCWKDSSNSFMFWLSAKIYLALYPLDILDDGRFFALFFVGYHYGQRLGLVGSCRLAV